MATGAPAAGAAAALPESPDRPVLMDALSSIAAFAKPRAQAAYARGVEALETTLHSAEVQAAAMRSAAAVDADARGTALAPWQTLGEQFSILEDELRARILRIATSERNFTSEVVHFGRRRQGNILPGCSGMANAALKEDVALVDLRFRLVPSRMSEEDFWRCYFWHVANIKCELLHDWHTANDARRRAVMEEEAALAPELPSPAPRTRLATAPDDGDGDDVDALAGARTAYATMPLDDLDAEFERLVTSQD